jgi:hypothetical protein
VNTQNVQNGNGSSKKDIPVVEVYRHHLRYRREHRQSLVFWCQYCKRWHWHGTCGGDHLGSGDGHRGAHCIGDTPYTSTGYVLREVGDLTPEMERAVRKNKPPKPAPTSEGATS